MPGNGNPNPGPPGGPPGNPNPGQPPGQAPNALNDIFSVDEDFLLSGSLFANNGSGADNDPNGDLFSVTALNGSAANVGSPITVSTTGPDGILREASLTVLADGTVTLDPLGNFDDLDEGDIAPITFTYMISDGSYTDTATVTVNMTGTNDAPVANPDAVFGGGDLILVADVLANDTDIDGDDDPSNFSLDSIDDVTVTGIAAGALTTGSVELETTQGPKGSTYAISFNPGTDFLELDEGDIATVEVDYTMSDDSNASSSSTFTVTIEGENDAPVANPDGVTLTEGLSLIPIFSLLANDTDVDGDDDPSNFSLDSIDDVRVTGIAAGVLTNGGVEIIEVAPKPGAPPSPPNSIDFDPGENWSDFLELDDGDVATVEIDYTMSDDSGAESSSTYTITILGTNSAPTATDNQYTLLEDEILNANLILDDTGSGIDSDPEQHTLALTQINGAAVSNGDVVLVDSTLPDGSTAQAQLTVVDASAGTFSLDPLGNFEELGFGDIATINFAYTVSDGELTDTADVQVTIDGVNDPPFNDPTPTAFDRFGYSVAIDGDNVLIGAPFDETNGTDTGQAHLFDATTRALVQTFNEPIPEADNRFGYDVAIDGNNVLIGEPFFDTEFVTDAGRAYLYKLGTPTVITINNPTENTSDLFGFSVAIDDNLVAIGAPNANEAYLFSAANGAFISTLTNANTGDSVNFGRFVAIDGNNVLIGDPLADGPGSEVGQAYLFDALAGSGGQGAPQLQTFDDPTPTAIGSADDFFGISGDINGNLVLIGEIGGDANATDSGQAHLFDATTGALLRSFSDPNPATGDDFGFSVAIIDSKNVLIGAPGDDTNGTDAGRAYLFDTDGNLLHTFNDPTPTTNDLFGYSVAVSGTDVLISDHVDDTNGPGVGQAHLFDVSGLLTA